MPISNIKKFLTSGLLFCVSLAISLALAEGILRLKNRTMTNYDIEMWRYSKELKTRRHRPVLDFDHVTAKVAMLQNVEIRLNEYGLRGGPVSPLPPNGRRILFLGSSITFGWGVTEQDTVEAKLEAMFKENTNEVVQVLNAGVGNYNTERYVSRFFYELIDLQPTDIVVHYAVRDAEELPTTGDNVLLQHSQLAVTLWSAYHRLTDSTGETSLLTYYQRIYQADAPGLQTTKAKLKQLADYAKSRNIRLYLAMTPGTWNLVDYKFGFIHDILRQIAIENGYSYCDLLPAMQGIPSEKLWVMPNDPHPNALGHQLMAKTLFPVLSRADRL